MRYPDFIRPGDAIGFAAPSFGCSSEPYLSSFRRGEEIFKGLGYRLLEGPNCYADAGIGKSNTPEKCAEELQEMYCSADSRALLSCGGGETMCEDLDFLDFDRIGRAEPKWYMGYSDNTNFTFTLTTICDVASVYGPCASAFGMKPWHRSLTEAFAVLEGKNRDEWLAEHGKAVERGLIPSPKKQAAGRSGPGDGKLSRPENEGSAAADPADKRKTPIRVLHTGSYGSWQLESLRDETSPFAPYPLHKRTKITGFHPDGTPGDLTVRGRLIGGCMDCLINLVGTRFDHAADFAERYAGDGILWYLESCDLSIMGMRRAVWQMKNAGWFDHAAGFLIGRPLHYEETAFGLDRRSAVLEPLLELGVPVILDADIGHLPPMMPLINGSLAQASLQEGRLSLSMELG